MKRLSSCLLCIALFILLFGCIKSYTPSDSTLYLEPGSSQSFSVEAYGTIQWYLNDVAVSGETGESYEFTSSASDEGTYTVKVVTTLRGRTDSHSWTVQVKEGVTTDTDGDGIADVADNCVNTKNSGQEDADEDGIGDACDSCTDADGDGYCADDNDCDDDNSSVNPGITETCNDIDDNCDGDVDEGCSATGLDAPQNVAASDVVITSYTSPANNSNYNDRVVITWDGVSGASYYEVYKADSTSGTYSLIATVNSSLTTYTDLYTEEMTDFGESPKSDDYSTDEAYETALAEYEATVQKVMFGDDSTTPRTPAFKDFQYYKVKAYSSSGAESNFSDVDEGRVDYTTEEFTTLFKYVWGSSAARVKKQDSDPDIGTHETLNGKVEGTLTWTIGYTFYNGSLTGATTMTWDEFSDFDGDRKNWMLDGTFKGPISSDETTELTGLIYVSDGFAAKVSLVRPYPSGEGYLDVTYNGVSAERFTWDFGS